MFRGLPSVFCDTEFGTRPDGSIDPRCAVFLFEDGTEIRLWEDELQALKALPFDVRNTLFVCYSAGAEIGVFLALGLALPHHVCDLYVEFLAIANGHRPKGARSRIIEAMAYFGLEPADVEEKTDMRALAMRGGPYTVEEIAALLVYCASDVYALKALFGAMADDLAKFHIREILLRGRFMVALARSHQPGVPVDAPFLRDLEKYSPEMAAAIAAEAEAKAARLAEDDPEHYHAWGIYKGARFDHEGYRDFLTRVILPDGSRLIDRLPTTPATGQPTSSTKELIKFAGAYPPITALCECMGSLDALSKFTLQIDADDCVRLFERPFGSTTARSTKSFFSFPKWMRPAVKPPKGWGVAYLDARAQEHLISGTKSGDPRMIADYLAGDVHQALVDQLGLTESGGKKARDRAKIINHAISYGQSVWGLAQRLGAPEEEAAEFAKGHESARQPFYRWRKSIVNGLKHKPRRTYFTMLGWPFWTGRVLNPRSMMNHPVQSDASDWMRVVMIAGTEAGILIVLSAHDGFLILSPEDRLEADIATMTLIMQAASEAMFGIPMFVDCDKHARAVWPGRLVLGGKLPETWLLVQRELQRIKRRKAA